VKEPQIATYQPEVSTERADEYPDLTAYPDRVGAVYQSPDGALAVHLGNGEWEDIDRTPGAFTAVRLWPHHSTGIEDYRLYDDTGKQVAHADVAIVGDHAHIANIEAADGVNTLGIKALRTLQTKLKDEFPELTAVKGLRSGGAGPGRTQEVEFRHSVPEKGKPFDRVTASTNDVGGPSGEPAVEQRAHGAATPEDDTYKAIPDRASSRLVPKTRTITLAEHIEELSAELRGSLDSRERETITAEIEAARMALKQREHGHEPFPAGGVPRSDATPNPPDFDAAVAKLSADTGLPHTPAASGEFVAGIYRQSLTLTSGQFAVIDNGLGFALVPWTAELDPHLGRHVSGVAMESGGIEWSFGRKRGLEI
jgi:hypothetical protein